MENNILLNAANKEQGAVSISECVNDVKQQDKEQGLLDFSAMFKKNGFVKASMPKLRGERKAQNQGANWLLQIPAKLEITTNDFEQRRYMNEQKWKMMVKANQPQESPICAVINSINYLSRINFPQSFTQIKLKQIRDKLNSLTNVQSSLLTKRQIILSCIKLIQSQYKLHWLDFNIHEINEEGKNQIFLNYAIQSLKNQSKAFIYISYQQTLCPIGFDNTPLIPLDAYKKNGQINPQQMEMWIICLNPLKSQAPFIIKRWTDIQKQMSSRWPQYLDLEEAKKGIQTWEDKIEVSQPKKNQVSCWIELNCSEQKI